MTGTVQKAYSRLVTLLLAGSVALLAVTGPATADDRADALAQAIVTKAGVHAGVCELPRVGDGTLAAALARAGIAQVHGLAPDAKAAETARVAAEQSGLMGSRVVIETGSASALPLGDWVADLLVVADASDTNLKDISPDEVRRVLAPYRGTAVVGLPSGPSAGLTRPALTKWAEETGGRVQIQEGADGLWAVIRMPALAGGDDWGHHLHAADGDLVSQDTVFGKAPFELQWASGPYYGGHWDIHVVSAGRMFTAQSSVFQHPGLPYEVLARSAYNGTVLWRRPIAKDFGESSSLMVATPERLFLKDGGGVLVLDAETGAEQRRLAVTTNATEQCLWLIESDGVLLALAGPLQKFSDINDCANTSAKQRSQEAADARYVGRELIAWDAAAGTELWRFREARIDPPTLVVRSGRVYLYADFRYAACLDLKTGKQAWKTEAPVAEPKGSGMGYIDGHATVKNMSIHRQGAVATKDLYFINYLPHRQCQAFAVADGKLLWQKMSGPTGNDPDKATSDVSWRMLGYSVVIGDEAYDRNWNREFDLLTGKQVTPGTRFNYGGCGRFTALANGLLIGQAGEIYDVRTNKYVLRYNAKASCGTGQFVADGLLFKVGANCAGCTEWRGFYASRSTPAHAATPTAARLEKGAASAPADKTADGSDWPTYRADATRKGSAAVTLPAQTAIRWTFPPAGTNASASAHKGSSAPVAPPVAVGGRVWVGTGDGAVVCLDERSGTELWRYWTAGRIASSPTWWQGRLYVGSCDGWVYCLDAASGALAWRYRAAPEERLIMLWGHLSSAWPIMANVLVADDAVFAVGGLIGQIGGVAICAIDARTGEPRWEKRIEGDDQRTPSAPRFWPATRSSLSMATGARGG